MKIKCLLKCTSESNDYTGFFSRQKTRCGSRQKNFDCEDLKRVTRRSGELARAGCQQNDRRAQSSNKRVYPLLHLHFFILSDKPWFLSLVFLAMNQITDWHMAWCCRGNGNYHGCTNTSEETFLPRILISRT